MHEEALGGGVTEFDAAVENRTCPYLNQLGETALGEMRNVYEQLDIGNYDALGKLAERLAAAAEETAARSSDSSNKIESGARTKRLADTDIDSLVAEAVQPQPIRSAEKTYDIAEPSDEKPTDKPMAFALTETVPDAPDVEDLLAREADREHVRRLREMTAELELSAEQPREPDTTQPEPAAKRHKQPSVTLGTGPNHAIAERKPRRQKAEKSRADKVEALDANLVSRAEMTNEPSEPVAETTEHVNDQVEVIFTDTRELLDSLSADIPALQPDIMDHLAEQVDDMLSLSEDAQEMGGMEPAIGDDMDSFAQGLEQLFDEQSADLSDDEFAEVAGALVTYAEIQSEQELTAVEPTDDPAVPESTSASFEEREHTEVYFSEKTTHIIEALEENLDVMKPETIKRLIEPVVAALESVHEFTDDAEVAEQAQKELAAALQDLFTEARVEIAEAQIKEIVHVLSTRVFLELLRESNEDLVAISQLFGTSEYRRFGSALKKMKLPLHGLLGKLTILACLTRHEPNEHLALAA